MLFVWVSYIVYDYGLQLMKTSYSKLEYCEKVFISVNYNHQKLYQIKA